MSGYRLPAPHGAWIDRNKPLRLQFNGRDVHGFAGDTVASAMLAQGIKQVGRSFKLHRPRGIFSCGVEEPTGLLDIGLGGARTPNTRATDIAASEDLQTFTGNAWPSLDFDLAALTQRFAALLPAGFYYKTFMWPHWHWFEPTIRRMAGLGVAADAHVVTLTLVTGVNPDAVGTGFQVSLHLVVVVQVEEPELKRGSISEGFEHLTT